MSSIIELALRLLGIAVGFVAGWINERRHLRRLEAKEAEFADLTVTNLKRVPDPDTVEESSLVIGQVVIATDYFKTFLTQLRNLVGGEMKAALSLLTRARREALVRLLEEARRRGAGEIWNVRFQFSSISQMRGRHGAMQVELVAYGTAIRRRGNAR